MSGDEKQGLPPVNPLWQPVLDLALIVWIARAPTNILLLGSTILLVVPQAQDLLVETALDPVAAASLTVLLMSVWALPTHYAARLLLETDERLAQRIEDSKSSFVKGAQTWWPRALGALTIAAMIGATFRSRNNVPDVSLPGVTADVLQKLWWLAGFLLVTIVLFLVYAVYRRRFIAAMQWVQRLENMASRLLTRLLPHRIRQFLSLTSNEVAGERAPGNLGSLLLILLFLIFGLLPMVEPYFFARVFPRAVSVPFVMGGWLPMLALLSGLGRRYRMPLIGAALASLAILPMWLGDNYDIRLIETGRDVSAAKIPLDEAVKMWKGANGCASDCPRPIIVAAAGGASRAGFFTASVVGQLLDDTLVIGGTGHGLKPDDMQKRLFAFSTVSGSSVGAAETIAALAASDGGSQPCTQMTPLWHATDSSNVDMTKLANWGWRACLEALMSGDFLTPVFIGFTFHDVFRFFGWENRGVLLERSFEEHFRALVGPHKYERPGTQCPGDLACPFLSLRPTAERWLPLLLLNSTSVESGQRIITTLLAPTFDVPPATDRTPGTGRTPGIGRTLGTDHKCPVEPRKTLMCPLFEYGQTFHELLPKESEFNDVRLSTAAHNSARFLLLSPPGEIRRPDGRLVDRIVDGGYFENLGAQTATELAEAMMAVDDSLKPFILVISNDPQLVKAKAGKADGGSAQAESDGSGFKRVGSVMTDIAAPLMTILNTRNARGLLAVADISAIMDFYDDKVCNVAHIQVAGEPDPSDPSRVRDLSWSWWLSKPVQIYLHEQTELRDAKPSSGRINERPLRLLLDAIVQPVKSGEAPPNPDCAMN